MILDDDPPGDASNHNGGAIHFGPDGKLYVARRRERTPRTNAQTLDNAARARCCGSTPTASIPTDNPFFTTATGDNRAIWALGLRNPFTFDVPARHRPDVHQRRRPEHCEEINEAWSGPNNGSNAGFNFGWPDTEGPTNDPTSRRRSHSYRQRHR